MGLKLEVIKWEDRSGGRQIVHRVPEHGMADIKLGARCIVQESQAAVFFRNGAAMDTLRAGAHTLSTENIPFLSKAFNLIYSQAPFQSAVYFVSLKPFRDLKWGTKDQITLKDAEFGYVNVGAFGKFSVRVTNPQVFVNEVVGTEGRQDATDIERWFKDVVCARFSDLVGEYMEGKSVLQIQGRRDELATATKARTADDFAKYGIELYDFIVSSIALPPAVKEALNAAGAQRATLNALGIAPGSQGYMSYMAANALRDAAKNPGQPGGAMGAGMGLGMGMMMPNMMAQAMYGQGGMPGMAPMGAPVGAAPMAPPPLPTAVAYHVALGGAQRGPFDAGALRGLVQQGQLAPDTLVWSQGMAGWTPAQNVPELAALFAPAGPPPLPPAMAGGPPPLPPT